MSNELRGLYDAIASGGKPSRADLDAEGLPTSFHTQVRADARKIHKLLSEGENARARALARECAAEMREMLPEDWDGPPREELTDDELADRIWRNTH